MKKISLLLVATVFAVTTNAQEGKKDSQAKPVATSSTAVTSNSAKEKLKDHVCTSACKDGKHVYAHGEKGHVCTAACKKTEKKK